MKNVILCWLLGCSMLATAQEQIRLTFNLEAGSLDTFANVGIRGSQTPLSWQNSIPLTADKGTYSVTLDFAVSEQPLEFKFVKFNTDNDPLWENIQNRSLSLTSRTETVVTEQVWNQDQIIDPADLPRLAPADLLKDFELIQTMVLDVHPGTYRYNDKTTIATALDSLRRTISDSLTYGEAYVAFSRLTAQLRCDHTKPGFNNQNRVINSVIHYQKDKLPFTFRWLGDQMVVQRNSSNEDRLAPGAIVHIINGVPVKEIKRRLLPLVAADGATDANRSAKLEVEGFDFRYNAFDVFYPLVFPVGDTLTVELEPTKGAERIVLHLDPVTRTERAVVLAQRYLEHPETRDDLWSFELLSDSMALLTMNSFGLYGWKAMQLDYKTFLNDAFRTLDENKVRHLVIDIRKNTGGNDEMADELFRYLGSDRHTFQREGRTRYLTFPEVLKPYIQTWGDQPWYYQLASEIPKSADGYYSFPESDRTNDDRALPKPFSGRCYLLTSNLNTSLAFYTAYRFKAQELGILIGQQTGGNLRDINGGQILFLRLPNSEIEIDFPVMGSFTLSPQPDLGVRPDYPVVVSYDDLASLRDVELETALRLIQTGQ